MTFSSSKNLFYQLLTRKLEFNKTLVSFGICCGSLYLGLIVTRIGRRGVSW